MIISLSKSVTKQINFVIFCLIIVVSVLNFESCVWCAQELRYLVAYSSGGTFIG